MKRTCLALFLVGFWSLAILPTTTHAQLDTCVSLAVGEVRSNSTSFLTTVGTKARIARLSEDLHGSSSFMLQLSPSDPSLVNIVSVSSYSRPQGTLYLYRDFAANTSATAVGFASPSSAQFDWTSAAWKLETNEDGSLSFTAAGGRFLGLKLDVQDLKPTLSTSGSAFTWGKCLLLAKTDGCLAPSTASCTVCPFPMTRNTAGVCEMPELMKLMDMVARAQNRQLTLSEAQHSASIQELVSLCATLSWPWGATVGVEGENTEAAPVDPPMTFPQQRTALGTDDHADLYSHIRLLACSYSATSKSGGMGLMPQTNDVVLNPNAMASLETLIKQQIETLRTMDRELCGWQKEVNLELRASQLWTTYDQATQGYVQYVGTVSRDQEKIFSSYGNVILMLNGNISLVTGRLQSEIDSAVDTLTDRANEVAKSIETIQTYDQIISWAKTTLQVVEMGVGLAQGGTGGGEAGGAAPAARKDDGEGGGASAGDAGDGMGSEEEGKKNAEKIGMALDVLESMILKFFDLEKEWDNHNPCSGSNCVRLQESLDNLHAHLEYMRAVQDVMGLALSLNRTMLTDATKVPSRLPELAVDQLTATKIEASLSVARDGLTKPEDADETKVNTDIGILTSLVRSRVTAIRGWYDAAVAVSELRVSSDLLALQHMELVGMLDDALKTAAVAERGGLLIAQRRQALASVVMRNIAIHRFQINYRKSHRQTFDSFLDSNENDNLLENFPLLSSIPATSTLAQRFLDQLKSNTVQGYDEVEGLTAGNTAVQEDTIQETVCWTSIEMWDEDGTNEQFLLLKQGSTPDTGLFVALEPSFELTNGALQSTSGGWIAASPSQGPSQSSSPSPSPSVQDGVPYWDIKVLAVRGYLLFGDNPTSPAQRAMSGEEELEQPLVAVSHAGQSLVVGSDGYGVQYLHNPIFYPWQYDSQTLCGVSESDTSDFVNPSPFGLWGLHILSGASNATRERVKGARLEFYVSMRTNRPELPALFQGFHDNAQSMCEIPLSIRHILESESKSPEKESTPWFFPLVITSCCLLLTLIVLVVTYKYLRVRKSRNSSTQMTTLSESLVR